MHSIFAFLAITTVTSLAPVELPSKAIVEHAAINGVAPTDAVRSSDVTAPFGTVVSLKLPLH